MIGQRRELQYAVPEPEDGRIADRVVGGGLAVGQAVPATQRQPPAVVEVEERIVEADWAARRVKHPPQPHPEADQHGQGEHPSGPRPEHHVDHLVNHGADHAGTADMPVGTGSAWRRRTTAPMAASSATAANRHKAGSAVARKRVAA